MRKENKYKIYTRSLRICERFPIKVIKFKRPKWARFKLYFQRRLIKFKRVSALFFKRRKFFDKLKLELKKNFSALKQDLNSVKLDINSFDYLNIKNKDILKKLHLNVNRLQIKIKKVYIKNFLLKINTIKNECRRWSRSKKFYRDRLKVRCLISTIFGGFIKKSKFNFLLGFRYKRDIYLNRLYKNYYKICILLWLSNLCSSPFQAKESLNLGSVLLNGLKVYSDKNLIKGDVLMLEDKRIFLKSNLFKFTKSCSFLSFLEIDYYSQNIVLIKSLEDLSINDFILISKEYIHIKYLL
jgi:hypothetical protein